MRYFLRNIPLDLLHRIPRHTGYDASPSVTCLQWPDDTLLSLVTNVPVLNCPMSELVETCVNPIALVCLVMPVEQKSINMKLDFDKAECYIETYETN